VSGPAFNRKGSLVPESTMHRMLRTLGHQHVARNDLQDQLRTLWPREPNRWGGLNQLLDAAEERGYAARIEGKWQRTAVGTAAVQVAAGLEPEEPPCPAPAEPPAPPPVERFIAPALPAPSAPRRSASHADLATPPRRPGADDALQQPSRMGNRLHYRDGRVTDLTGLPVAA
jgi:hypothetical protein